MRRGVLSVAGDDRIMEAIKLADKELKGGGGRDGPVVRTSVRRQKAGLCGDAGLQRASLLRGQLQALSQPLRTQTAGAGLDCSDDNAILASGGAGE